MVRLLVRQGAAACRSCVRDNNKTEGGCGCQDMGRGGDREAQGSCWRFLRPCFARPEPWLQAGKYVVALAGDLPRRNGWTIAQRAGDRAPLRTQRLLNRAAWDTFAAMGAVRRFAVAGLDEAARRSGRGRGLRVGAIDETSHQKQGAATAGVKRHYLGCAGKVAKGSPWCTCRMCASGEQGG
jgi:DDE superfamily endonuclease